MIQNTTKHYNGIIFIGKCYFMSLLIIYLLYVYIYYIYCIHVYMYIFLCIIFVIYIYIYIYIHIYIYISKYTKICKFNFVNGKCFWHERVEKFRKCIVLLLHNLERTCSNKKVERMLPKNIIFLYSQKQYC